MLFYRPDSPSFRSHVGKIVNGKEKITHSTSRQCPICANVFAKSVESLSKHTKICTAREAITYTFDNGDIISFQDNTYGTFPLQDILTLKQLPVTLFFFTQECVLCPTVRYKLSTLVQTLKKFNVIFRSFQQSLDEIYDLSHFQQEHVAFFDRTTFFQLKDTATAVLAREKATSLAELFSAELKFTIDTFNNWF